MHNDKRLTQLKTWIFEYLKLEDFKLTPLRNDASFRRYFRVELNGQTWVAMDAPPEKENSLAFLNFANWIKAQDILVPEIFSYDLEQGFLLLSDLGDLLLLQALSPANVDSYYHQALHIIIKLQQKVLPQSFSVPKFDAAFMERELQLFSDWFLRGYLQFKEGDEIISQAFKFIIQTAVEQPQTFIHRDFHSRNMLIQNTDTLGILDFQDAMIGPCTYDVVSLLKDCYIKWPDSSIEKWALDYFAEAKKTKLVLCESETFLRWFHVMGLQRHLRILGTFSRLYLRDNKPSYQQDMPLILDYCINASKKYPAFYALHKLLFETVQPLLRQRQNILEMRTHS